MDENNAPRSRRPRQFGFGFGLDRLGFPTWNVVEVVRLNRATGQDVDAAQEICVSRHLRLDRALYRADVWLGDADRVSKLLLRPAFVPPPCRKLHTTAPSRQGVPDRDQVYCGSLYLVNGHNETTGSEYNAVAYVYVMHPGNRIRALRKRAGLSQGQLAERVGTSQEYVSQLENDKRPLKIEQMRAFARELNCNVADLLDEKDHPERLADDERELLEAYRMLSADERAFIRTSATAVADRRGLLRAAG